MKYVAAHSLKYDPSHLYIQCWYLSQTFSVFSLTFSFVDVVAIDAKIRVFATTLMQLHRKIILTIRLRSGSTTNYSL